MTSASEVTSQYSAQDKVLCDSLIPPSRRMIFIISSRGALAGMVTREGGGDMMVGAIR